MLPQFILTAHTKICKSLFALIGFTPPFKTYYIMTKGWSLSIQFLTKRLGIKNKNVFYASFSIECVTLIQSCIRKCPTKIIIKQKQLMHFLCTGIYSMCFINNNLFLTITLWVKSYLYVYFTSQEIEAKKDQITRPGKRSSEMVKPDTLLMPDPWQSN